MKAFQFLAAALAILAFAGCETDSGGAAGARGNERAVRVILDSRSQAGSSYADDLFRGQEPYLEQLRTRGLSPDILRDLERLIRQDIEDSINEAIVPVFAKAFTPDEITAIANFLTSAPGKEFVKQARLAGNTAAILANADPALRPQIREFLVSPAGQKFITSSASINTQARNAIQERWVFRAPQREQAIQQIVAKNQR